MIPMDSSPQFPAFPPSLPLSSVQLLPTWADCSVMGPTCHQGLRPPQEPGRDTGSAQLQTQRPGGSPRDTEAAGTPKMILGPFRKLLPGPLQGTGPPEQGPVGKAPLDRQSAQRLWGRTFNSVSPLPGATLSLSFSTCVIENGNSYCLGAPAWCQTLFRAFYMYK